VGVHLSLAELWSGGRGDDARIRVQVTVFYDVLTSLNDNKAIGVLRLPRNVGGGGPPFACG
jgi:hypothetical protein